MLELPFIRFQLPLYTHDYSFKPENHYTMLSVDTMFCCYIYDMILSIQLSGWHRNGEVLLINLESSKAG